MFFEDAPNTEQDIIADHLNDCGFEVMFPKTSEFRYEGNLYRVEKHDIKPSFLEQHKNIHEAFADYISMHYDEYPRAIRKIVFLYDVKDFSIVYCLNRFPEYA